jgi:hypothetical protein
VFAAIDAALPTETWTDFIASLRPHEDNRRGGRWYNRVGTPLNPAEVAAGTALQDNLDEITSAADKADLNVPATLGPFQDWLFDTARFSFQTGRLVTQRKRAAV